MREKHRVLGIEYEDIEEAYYDPRAVQEARSSFLEASEHMWAELTEGTSMGDSARVVACDKTLDSLAEAFGKFAPVFKMISKAYADAAAEAKVQSKVETLTWT